MLLAMAEVWVLLLGEIDLVGRVRGAASRGVIMAELLTEKHGGLGVVGPSGRGGVGGGGP